MNLVFATGRNASPPERNRDLLISVAAVLPSGEAKSVGASISSLAHILAESFCYYEILLIDNATDPGMACRLRDVLATVPNVRLVRLSRRYGFEVALTAALDHAIGDYLVVVDLLSDPLQMIPELVACAESGFDAVVARPDRPLRKSLNAAAARLAFRLASRVLGFQLTADESYFRLFSRRLVNSLVRIRSKNRYLSCLNGVVGFRQCAITYPVSETDCLPRRGLSRQLLVASDSLVSNSGLPLRFAALLGLSASVLNALYLLYIFCVVLVKRQLAEGWLTTSLTHTVMFLLMFFMLAILAEYIARILDETKQQPLYFVESESSSTTATPVLDRLNVV